MNKKGLIAFILIGLAGGLLCGIVVYDFNNDRMSGQAEAVIREFFTQIAEGNLSAAAKCLAASDRGKLEHPNTALGEAVYRELRLISLENVHLMENQIRSADIVLRVPDTLKIMAKALELLPEGFEVADEAEQDALLDSTYEALLARADLPTIDLYLTVRLTPENGSLRVLYDTELQSAIEGNVRKNLEVLRKLGGVSDEDGM